MSFILDALRKSEHERQRNSSPGLAEIPSSARKAGQNRWMPLIVALLAINMLILTGILLWPEKAGSPDQVANAAPEVRIEAPTLADPPRVATSVPRPVAGSAAEERDKHEVRPLSQEIAGPVPVLSASQEATIEPVVEQPLVSVSEEAAASGIYPTLNDLLAAGMIALPDMHIDIHVFSDNPAERFIFLNMRKYREGDATREGPTVHAITTDGVVLEYRDTMFLVPTE